VKPVLYIFANKGLGMSAPKLAGMVLQAGILSWDARSRVERDSLAQAWLDSGMMKVVLQAEDTEQLRNIEDYLTKASYRTFSVIDEGRTEVRPFSFTTMAVELVDKDAPGVQDVFGQFKTYREDKPDVDKATVGNPFWLRAHRRLARL
jgi:peptidyl-tRNA hydrolase